MAETTKTRSAEKPICSSARKQRLPGGVLGTSRYADDAAFVVKHGKGSKIYDVSGREYIDYVLGVGPAHPGPRPSRRGGRGARADRGRQHLLHGQRADHRAGRGDLPGGAVRRAGALHLDGLGGDLLRAARGPHLRKRDKILKFEGGYHGAHDYAMMSSSPRSPKAFPAPVPDSSGIPHAHRGRGADRAVQRPRHRRGHRRARTPTSWPRSSSSRSSGSSRPSRVSSQGCARSPGATASCSSSTRSSPASAWPTAAPRSTTASCPTSPAWARSWAAASRSAAVRPDHRP